ncbi:MAG TPA: hypothetical protein VNC22_10420, partial [Sporichthya sp.]|nr:hypothetical protein [Sporichthya sp.]
MSATSGTVTAASDVVRDYHKRSVKCMCDGSGNPAYAQFTGVLADAGRRQTAFWYFDNLPDSGNDASGGRGVLRALTSGNAEVFTVGLRSTGILTVSAGGSFKAGTNAIPSATWKRVSVSFNIGSTSSWTVNVYVDGVLEIGASNIDFSLGSVGAANLRMGWPLAGAAVAGMANKACRFSDIYADDSGGLIDVGPVCTTVKLPAAANTNNWDTLIGSATNRWDYVSERPLSESKGVQQAGTTSAQENYTLQTASAGDVDITNATYVARNAWVWAKRGSAADITSPAAGAKAEAASGNLTLSAPASPSNNDIWIAAVHSTDQVTHTLSGWTNIANFNGGGTASHLSVWYFRYAGSTPNLVVGHTGGDSIVGGIRVFRGCRTSGSPVVTTGSTAAGTGTQTGTGITPAEDRCVVVFCTGRGDDDSYSAISNYTVGLEDAAGGTQNCYQTTLGTDGSVAIYYQIQSVPLASTGTLTATSAATDPWASIIIALAPDAAYYDASIMDNGTETRIVLTTASALYTRVTDSSSYPSNAAGIGMKSTGSSVDTFLYECGTIVAYLPTYTATVAMTAGHASLSASATYAAAAVTYTAAGSLTSGKAVMSASGAHTPPTYAASGSLTSGKTTASATSAFAAPVYTATAALSAGPGTASASATSSPPVYAAAADLNPAPAS